MQIKPLTQHLGAEVLGADLSALKNEAFEQIHRAFLEHQLLVFRNQSLDPESQVAFSKRFGELDIHVLAQYNHEQYPEIFVLSNVVKDGKPMGISDGGSYWHSDFAFREQPALTTILNAIQIPPEGGKTLFISMYQAYENLDDDWKQRLAGLKAIHRYRARNTNTAEGTRVKFTDAQRQATPDVIHPIVRTHPETGRKALFVHPGMAAEVVGVSPEESEEILQYLFEHATQEKFQYAFSWSPGDVVMWDNRCTMHRATTRDLPAHMHRTIYRTTVQGDRPV